MGYEFKRPDATAMERVLARHPADPEGAVLRLAWQAGLSREEIAGLTWPQVDLTDSVLYQIGRASCRERVEISGVAGSLKKIQMALDCFLSFISWF